MKLTILGLGTMTGAILTGAIEAGAVRAEDVRATTRSAAS
ncbi:pyrroline-5-carboxylate reductase, partial [Micrococcus endophyticus]